MGAKLRFDWDAGNREKCVKHGVSLAEIESVFAAAVTIISDPDHSTSEARWRAIGRTKSGRHVFVAFTIRAVEGADHIRPISARYMHRQEILTYEEANPPAEKGSDFQD